MSDSEGSIVKVKRKRKVQISDDDDPSGPLSRADLIPKRSRLSRRVPSQEDSDKAKRGEVKDQPKFTKQRQKQQAAEEKKKKLEEQASIQQSWKCAWCGVGWEQAKRVVRQDEQETVGSLCARCGARFLKGKGPLLENTEGFRCECRRIFQTYKSLIEHEKKCDKDAVFVELQVYVLSRPLSPLPTVTVTVKKNVILQDFISQVRTALGACDGLDVCLFVGIDSEERGARPVDSDKNLKIAMQEQKVYVQICLFRLEPALFDLTWADAPNSEGKADEMVRGQPRLQTLAVWRGQEFRKTPAFVFPSAWVSGPNLVPFEWGVFADASDQDFSDHEAMKLAAKMIHNPRPVLIYYKGQPAGNWNKDVFGDELKWLRTMLSPLIQVLISDSVQKNQTHQLFIVLPIELLVRLIPHGCVNDLIESLFRGVTSSLAFTIFLTCAPSDGQIPSYKRKNDANFLLLQVIISQGEAEADEESYAMSLVARLEEEDAPISVEVLEQECPPPDGLSTHEVIKERPSMFHLTKDSQADNKLMVTLTNNSGDQSEPEAGVDWEPENHSDYDDDESDLQDVVLAPEGSSLLHFTKQFLAERGCAPTQSDFQKPFAAFAVGRSVNLINNLIRESQLHQHWFSGPYSGSVPGQDHFNQHAHRCMVQAGLNQPESEFQIHVPAPGVSRLQPYQKTVSFLVHPLSPVQRMLVVHRTGAGKTLSMIRILDNFFHDPRPKIVVFPTESVANNFYLELLKFPNAFRDFIEAECPKITQPNLSANSKITLCRDILMMSGVFVKGKMRKRWRMEREHRLVPAAPVRSYSYMRAGGQTVVALDKKKQPRNALIKVMWDNEGRNPYTNKICLMDEIHNMTTEKTQFANWKEKLVALQKMLSTAKNATVVGFTATPVQEQAKEAETLLSVIKGQRTDNHEGFISFFHSAPTTVFPAVTPRGVPEFAMPEVVPVKLKGQNLSVYALKHSQLSQQNLPEAHFVGRMTNYCSMGSFYTRASMAQERKLLLDDSEMFACKLYQIAKDVMSEWERLGGKAVVMLHRSNGWKAMSILLSHMCKANEGFKCASYPPCLPHEREFSCDDVLQAFNSPENDRGQNVAVLVVDAKEAGEGVSLLAVRRLYLGDTPKSWLEYQQRVGRAVRFCGHQRLESHQRNLHVKLYLTICPTAGRKCGVEGCSQTDYTPAVIEALPDPSAGKAAPRGEDEPEPAAKVVDPQLKCATCSKWFCCPQHWTKGHPPCRGRTRILDERLGLETADQLLYRRLKQAFAAGSPLTELKRVAVDADILRPTLGDFDNNFDGEVSNDEDAAILFVPRVPSISHRSSSSSADIATSTQTNQLLGTISSTAQEGPVEPDQMTSRFTMGIETKNSAAMSNVQSISDNAKIISDRVKNMSDNAKTQPSREGSLVSLQSRLLSPQRVTPGGPFAGPISPYQASDYEDSD